MSLIEIPYLLFDDCRKWSSRPRPSQDFDVPLGFGILGLYVLAASAEEPPPLSTADLPKEVVYIGMSRHVDRRLERSHNGVSLYKSTYSDAACTSLWFSVWRSEWSSGAHRFGVDPIALATVAVYERAVILAYARKHGELPALNRE